jgi:hypothetical protein
MAEPNSPRKRGNPNWGSGAMARLPILPTEFEMQVRQLRLTPEQYVISSELRTWCDKNRNHCYIPEWLLDEWGFRVDADFSGSA